MRERRGRRLETRKESISSRINNDAERNYTGLIATLRDPEGTGLEEDALIDNSFVDADSGADPAAANCTDSKAGYYIGFDAAEVGAAADNMDDFGWVASHTSFRKTGRKDFSTYGDGVIKCTVDASAATAAPGAFTSSRTDGACD